MPEQNTQGQGQPANQDPNAQGTAQQAQQSQQAQQQGEQGAPNTQQSQGQSADDQKMVPLAALHEAREELKTLRSEVEAMRALRENPNMYQQYQQQQPLQDYSQQLEQMWDEDPRRAMQTEVMMALSWYDSTNAELDSQEHQIAGKYKDFDQYRTEVRRYLRSIPVSDRARPGMVESAYYFVKGRGADNLLKAKEEELLKRIRAGEAVQGITHGTMPSSASDQQPLKPTQEQINAAAAMGMKVEDYMQGVKR